MLFLAERWGFEPQIRFWRIHDFQSCSFGQLGHLSTERFATYLTQRKRSIAKKPAMWRNSQKLIPSSPLGIQTIGIEQEIVHAHGQNAAFIPHGLDHIANQYNLLEIVAYAFEGGFIDSLLRKSGTDANFSQ